MPLLPQGSSGPSENITHLQEIGITDIFNMAKVVLRSLSMFQFCPSCSRRLPTPGLTWLLAGHRWQSVDSTQSGAAKRFPPFHVFQHCQCDAMNGKDIFNYMGLEPHQGSWKHGKAHMVIAFSMSTLSTAFDEAQSVPCPFLYVRLYLPNNPIDHPIVLALSSDPTPHDRHCPQYCHCAHGW